MATPYLPTEQAVAQSSPEVLGIERQRKLADLLTAQGFSQPQGQMISGHYVAPSWTQQLAPMANVLAGTAISERADKQQTELAAALRGKQAKEIEKFGELEAQDKAAALRYALSTDNPILRNLAQEQLKGIKLSEGDVFTRPSLSGGVTELKGAPKYHAPTSVDMGTLGTMLIYPDGRREMVQKGREGPAGQVLETENGPMLVNTRTGQAQPIMANGQPVAGGKPLTDVQGNATGFGIRAKQANQIATTLENKGITVPGVTSTVASGIMGLAPFVGEKYAEATKSAFNVMPEMLGGLSSEQQQNAQARKNFVSAVLRKESGAAISPKEYADEEKKYFPQLGDSKEVIKQKQDAREAAIKALEVQAGPGKRQIEKLDTGNTGGWSVKSVK